MFYCKTKGILFKFWVQNLGSQTRERFLLCCILSLYKLPDKSLRTGFWICCSDFILSIVMISDPIYYHVKVTIYNSVRDARFAYSSKNENASKTYTSQKEHSSKDPKLKTTSFPQSQNKKLFKNKKNSLKI